MQKALVTLPLPFCFIFTSFCRQHVVTEETMRVFSKRDVRTLRDLLERTNACMLTMTGKIPCPKYFQSHPIALIYPSYISMKSIDKLEILGVSYQKARTRNNQN